MRSLLLLVILVPVVVLSQGRKIKTIKTSTPVIRATVDRAGDFYVTLKTGEIQKYDKQGKFINSFIHKGIPTVFDPTNAMKLLVYYHDSGEYAWLSPSLELSAFQKIDPALAIEPILICPSGERDLWILDAADFSLRKVNQFAGFIKIDPITGKQKSNDPGKTDHGQLDASVTNEFIVTLDMIPSANAVTSMREYQNVLFLFDQKHGIALYNNLGKLIRSIEVSNLKDFNFLGEELYFMSEGKIKFLDMFTGEKHELALTGNVDFALLTDERMVLVKNDQIDVYEFQPVK